MSAARQAYMNWTLALSLPSFFGWHAINPNFSLAAASASLTIWHDVVNLTYPWFFCEARPIWSSTLFLCLPAILPFLRIRIHLLANFCLPAAFLLRKSPPGTCLFFTCLTSAALAFLHTPLVLIFTGGIPAGPVFPLPTLPYHTPHVWESCCCFTPWDWALGGCSGVQWRRSSVSQDVLLYPIVSHARSHKFFFLWASAIPPGPHFGPKPLTVSSHCSCFGFAGFPLPTTLRLSLLVLLPRCFCPSQLPWRPCLPLDCTHFCFPLPSICKTSWLVVGFSLRKFLVSSFFLLNDSSHVSFSKQNNLFGSILEKARLPPVALNLLLLLAYSKLMACNLYSV